MSMHPLTKRLVNDWLVARAARADENIGAEDLKIDVIDDEADAYLPNTVEITVIYAGSVDEEFLMSIDHSVELARDVIAKSCYDESLADAAHPDWTVLIMQVSGEHGDWDEPEQFDRFDSDGDTPA